MLLIVVIASSRVYSVAKDIGLLGVGCYISLSSPDLRSVPQAPGISQSLTV